MKRTTIIAITAAVALVLAALPALAEGTPDAHGQDGRSFGEAVSDAATSEPGAIAAHVTEELSVGEGGGDAPAYGKMILDGFGAYGLLVKALVQDGEPAGHEFPPVVGAKVFWTVHGPLLAV